MPQNPGKPYGTVLFDLDGTLLDTLPSVYRCFGDALEPFLGKRPSYKEIQARFGPADHTIIAEWVGPKHAEKAVELLYEAYASALDTMGVFPGIEGLLSALTERGVSLGLVTGRGRKSTDWLLREKNLEAFFPVTVGGDEVAHPKPHPEGLIQALDRLEASAATAVYVGDSWLDLRAAGGAGIDFLGVTWGTQETGALEDAGAKLAHSVAELKALLLERAAE